MRSSLKPRASLGSALSLFLALSGVAQACEVCTGTADVTMVRNVRRMQPEAKAAHTKPKGPLEWGQLNFLHTTDTHGWLEGHIKEENYGADWGDYASFVKNMRRKAKDLCVDLLVVDTGDLHDGNGLSDSEVAAGKVNGARTNKLFEKMDYDLMTIGNHELYVSDIAYETYEQFSPHYGDKYITSNVQIMDKKKGTWEYIGAKYRHFKTDHGVNVMAFGVLFDFSGNSNVSKVIKAADMIKEQWFVDALKTPDIDLFVLFGHNPVKKDDPSNSLNTVHQAIRAAHKDTPVQIFGGHTHIRDFRVYDEKTTALESGRYCETLGWLSINNFKAGGNRGAKQPRGVPKASRPALNGTHATKDTLLYSRRYLDWNRLTMNYHTKGYRFDTPLGQQITTEITQARKDLNLTQRYGCVPESYCMSCVPQSDRKSIWPVVTDALATTIVNTERKGNARMVIANTGSIRFDLVQGPFTYDDSFIVSPFADAFQYIPDVPYSEAIQVLPVLNTGPRQRKRRDESSAEEHDHDHHDHDHNQHTYHLIDSTSPIVAEPCPEPLIQTELKSRSDDPELARRMRKITKRQDIVSAGYTTTDDWGNDGDDTPHSRIPFYPVSNCLQAKANFPSSGDPEKVDLIFVDFIAKDVINALNKNGGKFTIDQVQYYLPQSYTTNTYLMDYVKQKWGNGTC